MNLPHLDRSDRRTIELIIERHPDIQDDLSRILQDIDRSLGEKTKEIKDLQQEVQELKDEVHDLLNA
jgi:hypothetical protein